MKSSMPDRKQMLRDQHQELMLLEKDGAGEVSKREVLGVTFVPLTGKTVPARGGDR